ncbi:MAG: putative sporulation protein YtxC [Actinobacteria bacterium]|nr:putative sporulation protein YtxC [Actinomycetota bacterium]
MQPISIGAAESIDAIRERLALEFRPLEDEGIRFSIDESNRGPLTFLGCNLKPGKMTRYSNEDLKVLFKHYVANAISDVIVSQWEKNLLKKIIRGNYYYFDKDEQEIVFNNADRNLDASDQSEVLYKVTRKSRILHKLLDYLDLSNEFVIEGFITFRLKDYMEELEDAVDRAVDDFLMEREYREFIRLLKYFVEFQEPRLDEVHVIMKPGGTFKLVDAQNNSINNEYLEEFVVEMVESEINYEDLLISALITIAPSHIHLHCVSTEERDESVETIKSVFSDRVTFCTGCHLCLPEMKGGLARLPENKVK